MRNKFEDKAKEWLEDYSFDDFLEQMDIDPIEAVEILFNSGMIDPDIFYDLDLDEDDE